MLRRDNKDKKTTLNVEKINEGVVLLNKMLKILFIVLVVGAVMIITYVFKAWKIFDIIKAFFKVLSPLFIGLVIAWLFNPLVTFLTKHKLNRVWATVLVYTLFITLLVVLLINSVPTLTSQINDFINIVPSITKNLTEFVNKIISVFEPMLGNNVGQIK